MADRPLSRQPDCPLCGCEAHVFRCGADLGDGVVCPCPPRIPTGIYPD